MGAKESKPCKTDIIQLTNEKLSADQFTKLSASFMDNEQIKKKDAITFIKKWLNGYLKNKDKDENSTLLDLRGEIDISERVQYFLCKTDTNCIPKDIKSLEVLVVKFNKTQYLAYIIQNNKYYYTHVLPTIITRNNNADKCKRKVNFSLDDD
jgi:hypothetical protein